MRILSISIVVALIPFAGCGSKGPALVPLQGVVTDAGTPIADMNVTFSPREEGAASWGVTDAEGKFDLTFIDGRAGCLPGEHIVSIAARNQLAGDGQASRSPRRIVRPREYRRTIEVAAKQEFIEIELSAKK